MPAAAKAKPAPIQSATIAPWAGKCIRINASSAAPAAWPSSRAVLSIPLAAPLRGLGALLTMTRLFGYWNSPNQAPHSAIRQQMSGTEGC